MASYLIALVALGTLTAVALIRGGKEPETINVSWRIHNMNGKPATNSVTAEQIMEQAQTYASTWASVGGQFDDGSTLERAEKEKDEFWRLVERLAFERDSYRNAMQEQADTLCKGEKIVIGIPENLYPEHLRNTQAEIEEGA